MEGLHRSFIRSQISKHRLESRKPKETMYCASKICCFPFGAPVTIIQQRSPSRKRRWGMECRGSIVLRGVTLAKHKGKRDTESNKATCFDLAKAKQLAQPWGLLRLPWSVRALRPLFQESSHLAAFCKSFSKIRPFHAVIF